MLVPISRIGLQFIFVSLFGNVDFFLFFKQQRQQQQQQNEVVKSKIWNFKKFYLFLFGYEVGRSRVLKQRLNKTKINIL